MAGGFTSIYILSMLLNGLLSSVNSRKQRALTELGMKASAANLDKQLEQQRLLQQQQFEHQAATQLQMFDMATTWPLEVHPKTYFETQVKGKKIIPLCLIIAPAEQSEMLKQIPSVWRDFSLFFSRTFPLNSSSPVVQVKYKSNFPVEPARDYVNINMFMKSPTLYIAPYATGRDHILGFTIAFWGIFENQSPVFQNFEIDFRKLYIDKIREEAFEFQKKCQAGQITANDAPALAKNLSIFEKETELFAKGNTFEYLDKNVGSYNQLKPSTADYLELSEKIFPVSRLLATAIADMFFVLEYGAKPILPTLATAKNSLPDMLLRGILNGTDDFQSISGNDFLNNLFDSYSAYAIQGLSPALAIEYMPLFRGISGNKGCVYEEEFIKKYLPQGDNFLNYDVRQCEIMQMIARKNIFSDSAESKLGKLVRAWCNSTLNNPTNEEMLTDAYSRAKHFLTTKEYVKALPILERVSEDNIEALYQLGLCYLNGFGVSSQKDKAISIFKEAVKRNSEKACIQLFFLLQDSEYEEAIRYLMIAVEKKNPTALYLFGTELEENGSQKKANDYYHQAALLGEPHAIKILTKGKK